jgi:hypothetical protein
MSCTVTAPLLIRSITTAVWSPGTVAPLIQR